ncbi:MAG: alkaline shock response membrane anchor protein AmaP [Anaerolineae bacterium]|nr:alkaline shock response membrane anchor protein AmaP [Anaerolineae bacterium]
MNVFNRLVVILLLLVIIVLAAIVAIVPEYSLRLAAVTFDWLYQGAANYMENNRLFFAGMRILIGGATILLGLLLLWLELRRPRKRTIRAQKLAGGEAHITVESVEQRLAYNIDQLPDVVRVAPRVEGKPRGVDIDLLLETSPEIDVPMKTDEVMQVTREVIVDRMGLKLGTVRVKIKHAPYPQE